MAKHIIDTESPDFDGIPMRLRESCKGQVLLGEDRRENGSLRGLITIDFERLVEVVTSEVTFPITVNSVEELQAKAAEVSQDRFADIPTQYHSKPYLEYLADDINGEDKGGHRKYAKIYEELMDEAKTKLKEKGLKDADITTLKAKFKQAKA